MKLLAYVWGQSGPICCSSHEQAVFTAGGDFNQINSFNLSIFHQFISQKKRTYRVLNFADDFFFLQ